MVDKISSAIDGNDYSVGLFIDLSKAFDTRDHKILFNKLHHYGIRGMALDWFKSYFKNRTQYVDYNGFQSSKLDIKCGVSQGSILRLILFLIYINDIATVSDLRHLILFADDTNIFMQHKNLLTLVTVVNAELQKLSNWFISNRLSINVKKT